MTRTLINRRTKEVLLTELKSADRFHTRFAGLMGRKHLPEGEGLLLAPCSSIHCFFMRMKIDVAFLDKEGKVLHVIPGMKPWRISPFVKGAHTVIEAGEGVLSHRIELGDVLEYKENQ